MTSKSGAKVAPTVLGVKLRKEPKRPIYGGWVGEWQVSVGERHGRWRGAIYAGTWAETVYGCDSAVTAAADLSTFLRGLGLKERAK